MRRLLFPFALVALAVPGAGSASAQTDSSTYAFHFERPGLPVPEYTFKVQEQGLGSYTALGVEPASGSRYNVRAAAIPAAPTETHQALHLNALALDKLASLFRASQQLHGCTSPSKGIADMGKKTLTWHEAGKGDVSCTYNYTQSRPVEELTDFFQGMALTLDLARRLESKQRFDRLALDGVMKTLVDSVKSGRATGLSNIQSTLQGLVDDSAVLERVRNQAAKMLEQSTLTP